MKIEITKEVIREIIKECTKKSNTDQAFIQRNSLIYTKDALEDSLTSFSFNGYEVIINIEYLKSVLMELYPYELEGDGSSYQNYFFMFDFIIGKLYNICSDGSTIKNMVRKDKIKNII